jgi:hypothetical protein
MLATSAKPRAGLLGRFWTRGTGLPDAAQAEVMKSMGGIIGGSLGGFVGGSMGFVAPTIVGITHNNPEMAVIFGTLWFCMVSTGLMIPRIMLQRWAHNPVSIAEVEALYEQRHGVSLEGKWDGLERAYLTLVRDAIKHNVSEQAAVEVRKAIRALGEAIERLPPQTASSEVDAVQLRREAESVQQQAAVETDSVTAASLLRQAEALLRTAQSAERSAVVLRRNAALRKELAAQTEALRLGLASLYAGAGNMHELTRLAEQVRGVATEANAVAEARSELDSFLTASAPVTAGLGVEPVAPVVNPVTVSATSSGQTATVPLSLRK